MASRDLRAGDTKSCGCLKHDLTVERNLKHGHSTRNGVSGTMVSFRNMHQRCSDKACPDYPDYGGRGITVCDRWSDFTNFLSDMGERPEGRSIDRVDNEGNYEPENCQWATSKEQHANRRPRRRKRSNKALCVGHGRMGLFHAKILDSLGYDVITVDPRRDSGADHRKIPWGLHGSTYDAVAIAVPIAHAAEAAAEWAGFGGHLLLEKPMAATYDEAVALADELVGVRVGIGYVERFNPVVRSLRKQVAGRRVTRATFTRWNPRPSWDAGLDLASHDADLAQWLGIKCEPTYRTWAESSRLVRRIDLEVAEDLSDRTWIHRLSADLTAHDANPLCAEWHALLTDSPDVATMQDAAAVLSALGR